MDESLNISVIVPARNERDNIGATLDRIARGSVYEIIVADGESDDGTADVAAAHGAVVVTCEPGRGGQLNAAADRATGDVLLFVHADTVLPDGFGEHVMRVLEQDGVVAGAFGLRIDAPQKSLRVIESVANYRSRARGLPYGDQAIFVRTDLFRQMGGFPDMPVMEDYEFMRRLRKKGKIGIAPACVKTSARRWLNHGIWRTTLKHQFILVAYHLGVSPQTIARWRSRRKMNGKESADVESPQSS